MTGGENKGIIIADVKNSKSNKLKLIMENEEYELLSKQ